MKIFIFIACFLLLSCSKQRVNKNITKNLEKTEMSSDLKFSFERYDLGTINKSEKPTISIDLYAKNIGIDTLVIHKIDVSCNCISTEYDKGPILPQGEKRIKLNIDTKFLNGHFSKAVFINSNSGEQIKLIRIVGNVNL